MQTTKVTPQAALHLSHVEAGSCVRILEVSSPTHEARLKAMGLCRDRRLQIVKQGKNLLVELYGTRVGLARELANGIEVELCASAERCWEKAHD